jgi:Fe-S-cluster containining protein
MNRLISENNNNRAVYRELFLKAHESIKQQLDSIKTGSLCKNCGICCKIRYSDLSPSEIYNLKKQGEKVSALFTELLIPYGADDKFNYENSPTPDIELNNSSAKKQNPEYVNLILSKAGEKVYFYRCRNLKNKTKCREAQDKNPMCYSFPHSISTFLPEKCGYREWQKRSLDKIHKEISADILKKLKEIDAYRQTFSCKKTGTCCRLASSEFSYSELLEKAKNGDNFASQFTSVFIPYKDREEARKIFPEYFDMLEKKLGKDEEVYFYHCPHISKDNLCTIYDNRPEICRDFPDNPLSILPPVCGYNKWKEEVEITAMLMHALIQICEFNIEKINTALKLPDKC